MNVLEINEVYKSFGDKEVLKGLSLSIPENSIFGFIGKNGSGKTTTMKLTLGLMRADNGFIEVCGERVKCGETPTNRFIGYLPDVPEFYSFMNAYEYLCFCGGITGMDDSETQKRASELLSLVGLENEKSRIKGYSRGMKQRLGIAQALLNRPKLLICDEPTSALDPVGRKEILDILSSVREQTTVLFSTHVLSDVERICTDVAFVNDGKAEIQGKLSDIKSKYRSEEYLFETETEAETILLLEAFPSMRRLELKKSGFCEKESTLFDVLNFVSEKRIRVLKMERIEPSLETLFVEVFSK